MERHNIKTKDKLYANAGGRTHINTEKASKQTKIMRGNKNTITKNYTKQNIRIMKKYY
jgi:ribosomal protein L35